MSQDATELLIPLEEGNRATEEEEPSFFKKNLPKIVAFVIGCGEFLLTSPTL